MGASGPTRDISLTLLSLNAISDCRLPASDSWILNSDSWIFISPSGAKKIRIQLLALMVYTMSL